MTQPLNREVQLPEIGEVDKDAGEFWVANPLDLPSLGENLSAYERNKLFLNVDGSRFVDASFASSADIDSDSRSVIATDIDRDGSVDLLVASAGGGTLRVFSNKLSQGNRLEIRLKGVKSNRQGIGSRIVAEFGDRKITRDLFPQNGFMGIGPAEVFLGVGNAQKIDRLTIRWPSGVTQELKDVEVNRGVLIEEENSEITTVRKF
ncbi:MAG: ASPIC/UnbV domain-containing protein [Mariniblastus sp.]